MELISIFLGCFRSRFLYTNLLHTKEQILTAGNGRGKVLICAMVGGCIIGTVWAFKLFDGKICGGQFGHNCSYYMYGAF